MDTKRLITNVAIVLVMVAVWRLSLAYLHHLHPDWDVSGNQTPATQPVASTSPTTGPAGTALSAGPTTSPDFLAAAPTISTASTTQPATIPAAVANIESANTSANAMVTTQPTTARVAESPTITIGSVASSDPKYTTALKLSREGAGIDAVTLNEFWQTYHREQPFTYQEPYTGAESFSRPLAMKSLTVDGATVDVSGPVWTLKDHAINSATYTATVRGPVGPVLEVDRTFTVFPKDAGDKGAQGYEVGVVQNFRNLTTKPVSVRAAFLGPVTPPIESDRSDDRLILAGYNNDGQIKTGQTTVNDLSTSHPTKDLTKSDDGQPLLWIGTASSYFDAIVRQDAAPGAPVVISKVTASSLNPDAPVDNRLAVVTIETNDVQLAPEQSAGMNLRVFFGPKKRELLNGAYYSAFPLQYNETLNTSGKFCGFIPCTIPQLVGALVWLLGVFHWIFRDWGVAIICLVVLVRICLHPITKKAQINMAKMQKMQPEIERLKKKHGDDKEALNRAMMDFYKEQGPTQILGCLPMFLQTPIWIALWSALQSTFELRQAPFFYNLTWIHDLARPDSLLHFNNAILLPMGWHLKGINLLPLLMSVVFYAQQKFMMPQTKALTPEQESQQKMMRWMSVLMFPLFLYNGPAGLNIYILTSTTAGVVEGKIIRKHIKDREDAEKDGKVVIDAKPTRGSKREKDRDKDEPPTKKTGIVAWLSDLQAKADQIRQDAQKQRPNK